MFFFISHPPSAIGAPFVAVFAVGSLLFTTWYKKKLDDDTKDFLKKIKPELIREAPNRSSP